MSATRNVLVLGAGGATGRRILAEAVGAGHHVTAGARRPEALDVPAGLAAHLTVVRTDVRDAGSLASAVEGQDVVVSAVGPSGRHAGGLYSDGARAIVGAMEQGGVRRFVGITSAGVRDDDPELALWYRLLVRPLLRELYDDMRLMEQIVRAADLDWTLVRPVLLLDREPTDVYRVCDGATPSRGRTITRADLARFVVAEVGGEIGEARWIRRAPTLAH